MNNNRIGKTGAFNFALSIGNNYPAQVKFFTNV